MARAIRPTSSSGLMRDILTLYKPGWSGSIRVGWSAIGSDALYSCGGSSASAEQSYVICQASRLLHHQLASTPSEFLNALYDASMGPWGCRCGGTRSPSFGDQAVYRQHCEFSTCEHAHTLSYISLKDLNKTFQKPAWVLATSTRVLATTQYSAIHLPCHVPLDLSSPHCGDPFCRPLSEHQTSAFGNHLTDMLIGLKTNSNE